MRSQNEVVVASAGSGKTTYLVELASADPALRTLLVTYTNENRRELAARLRELTIGGASRVTVMTWFEFLLRDGVKPYQSYATTMGRVRSINFQTRRSRFARKKNFDSYYIDDANNLYSDTVSDLVCSINDASDGKVVARLEGVYDQILIDEVQDLAGYDLELLQLLLNSALRIVMVGDPRQAIYATNQSGKNPQYRFAKIVDWFDARVAKGECTKTEHAISHRCCQPICDFADQLHPSLPTTTSMSSASGSHQGVFLVRDDHVGLYRARYEPQDLRWDRRMLKAGPTARNFGEVKGQAFDRVLIHPTGPITAYIESGTPLPEVSAAKFYVAVTRARHSVAIVTPRSTTKSQLPIWVPDGS